MSGSLEVIVFTGVEGPLLNSDPGAVLAEFDAEARKTVAERGVEILKAWPFKSSRGGGFQRNLRIVEGGNVVKIPGPQIRGVTWSPWLEGTSKRNRSASFRGYHLFKLTSEQLQEEAGAIAEKILPKYLAKLGGD